MQARKPTTGDRIVVSKVPSKKEQRRLARQAKQAQAADRRQRAKRRRMQVIAGVAVIAAALVSWAVWASTRPKPGIAVADQGREHIPAGRPHPAYNSNPPTSGWHYPAPAPWGFYPNEIPDEVLVHNLEHGGIWISYKNPDDTEVVDKLTALVRQFPKKVIVTLRKKNDSRIAVAAWARLLKLEQYDEKQIRDFIRAFRNKGPETTFD